MKWVHLTESPLSPKGLLCEDQYSFPNVGTSSVAAGSEHLYDLPQIQPMIPPPIRSPCASPTLSEGFQMLRGRPKLELMTPRSNSPMSSSSGNTFGKI